MVRCDFPGEGVRDRAFWDGAFGKYLLRSHRAWMFVFGSMLLVGK